MITLKVSSKSNPNSVAGALTATIRDEGKAEILAVGASAINQAVKAIAIANGFVAPLGSSCNFNSVATEFACQGLELNLPVLAWGDDLLWNIAAKTWTKYTKLQKDIKDPNLLRLNCYRVLMTRERDGLIIYVLEHKQFDDTYNILVAAGLKEI